MRQLGLYWLVVNEPAPDMTTREPLRVLLVEDSENDERLVLRALRREYAEVHHQRVEDAAAMRAALLASPWDVILSDWSLPRFCGSDALRLVQETGLDVPFVLVSGTLGEETAVEVMRAGAR